MTQSTPRPVGPPLPKWMMLAGSVAILFHLSSVMLNVLAAPSGPWPGMEGADMAMPPQAFASLHQNYALPYLRVIKQTHNYHFRSNRVGQPDASLEVLLYDNSGGIIKTIRIPDPKAPAALRRKQAAFVRWLTDDQPVSPNMGEKIPAPNATIPEIPIWEPVPEENRKLSLISVPENETPRDRQVFRPSPWSMLVLRSYARHLCKTHGAVNTEMLRHSREAIPPRILFEPETPPEMGDLISNYGRLP